MANWIKKSESKGNPKKDTCVNKATQETFSAFLKDTFQLIVIMGVFGAFTIYLNAAVGFFNQNNTLNLGIIPNLSSYLSPDNIFYRNGLTSFGAIILSIGIASSLWIFCIISINILNQAIKVKYQNKIDSYSNAIFIFSLTILTLVVVIVILKQFINLYLFYVVIMFLAAFGWLKNAYEQRKGLKIKTWGYNRLVALYILSNILYFIGITTFILTFTISLLFKIPTNYYIYLMLFSSSCILVTPFIDKYLNIQLKSFDNKKICSDIRGECKYRGPNYECTLKDQAKLA